MKRVIKGLIIGVGAILSVLFCTPVYAEECTEDHNWLSIMPVSQKIVLEPGTTGEYEFTVSNVSMKPTSFKVYASAFQVSNEDYKYSFPEEITTYTQIVRWISFMDANGNYGSEAVFSVDACSDYVVKYRVNVPTSIPGGYQGAVIFTENIGNNGGGNIKALSRIGLNVSGLAIGETVNTYEISDFKILKNPDENLTDSDGKKITNSVIHSSVNIKNTGNVDITPTLTLTVSNVFGSVLYQDTFTSWIIPDSNRNVVAVWEKTPLFGLFKANYSVNINGKIESFSGVILIMPTFVIVIILLLVAVVCFWIISLIEKNRERKNRRV